MKVHYLEIVASNVDAVCAAYEAAHGIQFGSADPLLGGARTAPLSDGGSIGVRSPLAGGPYFGDNPSTASWSRTCCCL
jgi:hypothetical protein